MSIRSWLVGLVSPGSSGELDGRQVADLLRRAAECQVRGDYGEAEEIYRRVLYMRPENADARRQLAQVLALRALAHQERGEFEDAVAGYEESLALDDAQAQVRINLGNAYQRQGRLEEAIVAFREVIAMEARNADAHLNLGIALSQTGKSAEAVDLFRTALDLRPSFAEASLSLGFLLEHSGDGSGAEACYRQAIVARPDYAEAHFNHALQLLLRGEYLAGWEEYEWRMRLPGLEGLPAYAGHSRWDGSALEGRTILLFAEQGFGDTIQFARFAPLVAARGGKVIIRCQPKLIALLRSLEGVATVLGTDAPIPAFDVCCPLMSLPRIFATTLETIPAHVPYIRPEPERMRRWRESFAGADASVLKVGLYWATDTSASITPLRTLNLETLAPLAKVPGVRYYSFQRGEAAREAAQPPRGMDLVDLSPELRDFSDDAAAMSHLDLIISINTATAHLAGAMGLRAWTLTHFPPDWRWFLGREDSPWYPTMRLFRRGATDSWGQVIERVAEALGEFAKRRTA